MYAVERWPTLRTSNGGGCTNISEMRPAIWLALLALLAAGWGAIAAQDDGPTAGQGPAEANASSERPLDPEGPWTVGPYDVRLSVAGQELELVGPLVAEADRGPVDRALLVAPDGSPLVGVDCEDGRCELWTPLGEREVPAATISMAGAWQQGRTTGLTLTAADGASVVTIDAAGDQGVRLKGRALNRSLTITSTLVVEGTPRDVDRLAVRGPTGEPLIVAEPGGRSAGRLTLADRTVRAPDLHVAMRGDPLTDEEVVVRLWARGERTGFVVHQTPAEAYGQAGEALAGHLVLGSPTRAREANVTLAAGPVQLDGPGTISPRFDTRARVQVANASGYDRGRLTVDGEPRAPLDLAGRQGDQRVFHGRVTAGGLRSGEHELGIRLERDLAPGVVQTQQVTSLRLVVDRAGPVPPTGVDITDGALGWSARATASTYEIRLDPPDGPGWIRPVEGTSARLPESPAGEWAGQVRGVDDVGNPGPWSREVSWTVERGSPDGAEPAFSFELEAPRPGDTLTGLERVRWSGQAVSTVTVDVRPADGGDWIRVAQGSKSPLSWDTRTVLDGPYRLRATAHPPDGPVTRLTSVTVDNLAEVTETAGSGLLASDRDPGSPEGLPGPLPGRPLPTALATSLGLLAAVGIGWAKLGRTGRGK